ncbi:histidine phosphatase family protein [Cyanobium sp. NIES-981]|uniref:histidine phosphatase family protein n=1 Tax=Cyanobium sp. NIES-981 TaxID=1851505 RepID=UPI0007DD2702|nr:histidine phosphatase family protein [Cyanobium sp. NIES-981]SBO41819.1 protein of unknown function [Cyanobium sp. NIES-981]
MVGLGVCAMTPSSLASPVFAPSHSFGAAIPANLPDEAPSPGENANGEFQNKLGAKALLNALLSGRYVICFRHAMTVRDYADQVDPNLSLGDCATQRKLSKESIQEPRDIGAAFTNKGITDSTVITSEYCRAWQTANLAFGRVDDKHSRLNFLPYEDYTDDLVALTTRQVTPLVTTPPPPGHRLRGQARRP